MVRRRATRRTWVLSLALTVLLVVVAWRTIVPTRLGGPALYVITKGTSMEPGFHAGDLAAVRRSDSYDVGDVVAYQMTRRSTVLHRIAGRHGNRFVMRGDNNQWDDATEPDSGQIAGRVWLHAPGFGQILQMLRAPWLVAALAAVVGLAIVQAGPFGGRPARTAMRDGTARMRPTTPSRREELLAGVLALLLTSAVLLVLSFSRPTQRLGTAHVDYQQGGDFSYSASAPGIVYLDNQVQPGDPIYLRLVRYLDLSFDYRFSSRSPHSIRGTYRLTAEISQQTGWRKTIELAPETPFEGDRASATGRLSLVDLQVMTAAFAAQTGIKGDDYTLTITPAVALQGTLAGSPLRDSYGPPLTFKMDSVHLALQQPADKNNALHPSQLAVADRPRTEMSSFSLFGVQIGVATVRIVTVSASMLAAVAVLILLWPMLASRTADEAARIQARYGSLILNVQNDPLSSATRKRVVDLHGMADLARAAEQQSRMILHLSSNDVHHYLVQDGDVMYRYSVPRGIFMLVAEKRRRARSSA